MILYEDHLAVYLFFLIWEITTPAEIHFLPFNNIFDKGGSNGNSAILLPSFVSNPSSSNAFNEYNDSNAAINV